MVVPYFSALCCPSSLPYFLSATAKKLSTTYPRQVVLNSQPPTRKAISYTTEPTSRLTWSVENIHYLRTVHCYHFQVTLHPAQITISIAHTSCTSATCSVHSINTSMFVWGFVFLALELWFASRRGHSRACKSRQKDTRTNLSILKSSGS